MAQLIASFLGWCSTSFLIHKPALAEMKRVTSSNGTIAAYVWDYAGKMELMRHFWDVAVELNPDAAKLDEGLRFPLCQPDALAELFTQSGLQESAVTAIDIPTPFANFAEFWQPFLGGNGPAPAYVMSLDEAERSNLRESLRALLPIQADGSIEMIARVWAVQGIVTK